MSKGWTEERRRKQAENIRKTRPWEKSTGPRTQLGKKRSSYNALKHGMKSRHMKDFGFMIDMNRAFLHAFHFWSQSHENIEMLIMLKNRKNKLKEKALESED